MTLLEEFEDLCKYIREVTGSDLVCGLCEYDAGTVGEELMECPGFDSNECFKLKESFKQGFPGYNGHEVIRCKDCRYYDARAKTMDALCTRKQGCRETIPEGFCGWAIPKVCTYNETGCGSCKLQTKCPIDEPTIDAEPHWIPCSERLPEKHGYYLTTTCYKQVYCDFWSEDHFDRTEAVVAWMPLPKPYEVEHETD